MTILLNYQPKKKSTLKVVKISNYYFLVNNIQIREKTRLLDIKERTKSNFHPAVNSNNESGIN